MVDLPHTVTLAGAIATTLLALMKQIWDSKRLEDEHKAQLAAKDETIQALKVQVETLKDFTPMKIREYARSIKEQLEEYNDQLQAQLPDAEREIEELKADAQSSVVQMETVRSLTHASRLLSGLSRDIDERTRGELSNRPR